MSDDGFKAFLSLIFAIGIGIATVGYVNCDAETRCASLRRQGVKVYLSEGALMKQCEVLERDVVPR